MRCEGSYCPRLDLRSAGYSSRSCRSCEWDVRPLGSQLCLARLVCKRGGGGRGRVVLSGVFEYQIKDGRRVLTGLIVMSSHFVVKWLSLDHFVNFAKLKIYIYIENP